MTATPTPLRELLAEMRGTAFAWTHSAGYGDVMDRYADRLEAILSARDAAGAVGRATLAVEIYGQHYDVPVPVQVHIVSLREQLSRSLEGQPFIRDLLGRTEHCISAADEGEDYAVSREMLDAMTTLGLMEKVGRGKWAPTEAAERFVEAGNAAIATPPAASGATLPPLHDAAYMTQLGNEGWSREQVLDYAREAVRLAAVAPAGMVLVPREPTHAMLCEAAKRVFAEAAEEFQDDGSFAERIVLDTQRKCYVAMIAVAAPTPPATAGKE